MLTSREISPATGMVLGSLATNTGWVRILLRAKMFSKKGFCVRARSCDQQIWKTFWEKNATHDALQFEHDETEKRQFI